jgi:hypothetical protein
MQAEDILNEQGLSDELQAQGVFVVEVLRDGKNGPEVVQRRTIPNLVVNTGKRQIWRMTTGLNTKVFKFMRIGTSGVVANSGQTNVISPVTGTLKTVNDFTLLSGTRTFQWVISYASGAGLKSAANIREVVVMNQRTSPGGSALSRSTFTAVNKTTADKLRITYRARVT